LKLLSAQPELAPTFLELQLVELIQMVKSEALPIRMAKPKALLIQMVKPKALQALGLELE
jgi:hypothetical protein